MILITHFTLEEEMSYRGAVVHTLSLSLDAAESIDKGGGLCTRRSYDDITFLKPFLYDKILFNRALHRAFTMRVKSNKFSSKGLITSRSISRYFLPVTAVLQKARKEKGKTC